MTNDTSSAIESIDSESDSTGYQVEIEQYQGPLDVLLQLIEQQELDITDISLAHIAKAFVDHLNTIEEKYPEELADFLSVAAKLIYLKSRALLPYLEAEAEEESATQLADRLKMYKEYRDATEVLAEQLTNLQYAVARPKRTQKLDYVEFSPPESVTVETLEASYRTVLDKLDVVIRIPKAAISKAVTLKERITALSDILESHKQVSFNEVLVNKEDKTEIVVTFLAVLELMKQEFVVVEQGSVYDEIVITKHAS